MKNRTLSALAVLAAGVLVTSCSAPAPKGPVKPRIALVLKTLNSPFFIEMQTGAKAAAPK